MLLTLTGMLLSLLPLQAEAKGADLASSGPLMEAVVSVDEGPAERFSFGFDGSEGVKVYLLSPERRPGLVAILGGHARTRGAEATETTSASSGLSLLFFLHFYADGRTFLEGQLLNDAIAAPPGKVLATYRITHRGEVVAEGKRTFYDETGVGFHSRAITSVPRIDLLTKYLALIPDPGAFNRVDLSDAEPRNDPDPTVNTHASGSPRNRYHAVEGVKFLATQDVRYLDRLLDFVSAQSRRPYHLSESNGEPFLAEKYPSTHIIEGKPELRPYLETLGRLVMSEEDREWGEYNGWDFEHLNVEELYSAYLLMGSRVARRELVLIAEQVLTTPYIRKSGYRLQSARSFGWTARALVRAYQATGQARYLDAVSGMFVSLRKHGVFTGPHKALIPQAPRGDHIVDERWESSFFVAIAASGLAMYLRERPEDEEAMALLRFCGDLLVERGYSEKNHGFVFDFSVESNKTTGIGDQMGGVVMFIASPLTEIALLVPESDREKYLDPARQIYRANQQSGAARILAADFYRWFLTPARFTQ